MLILIKMHYICRKFQHVMTFDKIHERLWAVRWDGEDDNEIARLFGLWHDVSYLRDFFKKYGSVVTEYFHTKLNNAISDTIEDAEYLETQILDIVPIDNLDSLFEPLGPADTTIYTLQRNKAKNKTRRDHDSWLRIYALKLNDGCYLITGGAIKMAQRMQETPETLTELRKIDKCRDYLRILGISDSEGLDD